MKKTIFYHYCTFETFMAIIRNSSIRLSSAIKSNDTYDCSWLLSVYENYLFDFADTREKALSECSALLHDKGIDLSKFKEMVERAFRPRTMFDFNSLGRSPWKISPFISCFSKEPDQLSQWRGYADEGQGVAIGFDLFNLAEACDGFSNLRIAPVSYELSEHKSKVSQLLYAAIKRAAAEVEAHTLGENSFMEKIASQLLYELLEDSMTRKNPSFVEEGEYRIVFNDNFLSTDIGDREIERIQLAEESKRSQVDMSLKEYSFKNGNVVPYYDLHFSRATNQIIKVLVLGPKCSISPLDSDLYRFVECYGHILNLPLDLTRDELTPNRTPVWRGSGISVYVSDSSFR